MLSDWRKEQPTRLQIKQPKEHLASVLVFRVRRCVCVCVCVCVCSANVVQIMPEMRGEQGAYAALLPRRAAAPYPTPSFSYCRLRAGLPASLAAPPPCKVC